jgi:hypothetical protein
MFPSAQAEINIHKKTYPGGVRRTTIGYTEQP